MNLVGAEEWWKNNRIPRVSGDEPKDFFYDVIIEMYSPRERG